MLTEDGWLLGVVTSSLLTNHAAPELGYGAALAVEPLWHILFDEKIFPASNADLMFELRDAWGVNESFFPFSAEKLQRLKGETGCDVTEFTSRSQLDETEGNTGKDQTPNLGYSPFGNEPLPDGMEGGTCGEDVVYE